MKKVDRGWYTYLVEGNGKLKMGHGRRSFVYDHVAAALEEIDLVTANLTATGREVA